MPSKSVTISDVAKACGVTAATVSRVLNKKKNFSASVAVRERIEQAARDLGYVPDLAARNLRSRKSYIIGVFSSPLAHVSEGINDLLLDGIREVLQPEGYDIFFELTPPQKTERPLPNWRFDGAILLQRPKPEVVTELQNRRVPYVCVNENVGDPIASILSDDVAGMRDAVDHLAALGHRRIAYANAPAHYFEHHSILDRHQTLLAEAQSHSLTVVAGHDRPISQRNPTGTDFENFVRHAINIEEATAIITYDHRLAIGILGCAYSLGLRAPADFSLICFNDLFPVAEFYPPITAVAVSGTQIGRLGAARLLEAISGSNARHGEEIRVAENLIVRASTAPPPSRSRD